jgi:phasin
MKAMTENIAARFGEKNIKDASEKLGAATEQTTKLMENTYAAAAKNIKDYNLKALEFAKVNSDSAFDYVQQLMSAKTPSEMLELWTAHARKQLEVLTEQTKKLSMLGQRGVTETIKNLNSGTTKAVNQAA